MDRRRFVKRMSGERSATVDGRPNDNLVKSGRQSGVYPDFGLRRAR
jgi:hypothetical protein